MWSLLRIGDQRFTAWTRDFALSVESLAIYRILYAVLGLAFVMPKWLWVPEFPDRFFNPKLSLASFFTGFPSLPFFWALNVVGVASLVGLLVGLRTRACSLLFAGTLLVGNSFSFAFGKINHEILYLIVPVLLAFAGWGRALSIDARSLPGDQRRSEGWPLALLALLTGFAMFTAALPKVHGGWLDPQSQATYGNLLSNHFVLQRQTALSALAIRVDVWWLWEILDWCTILLEAGILFTTVALRSFRLACIAAVAFHVSIYVLMDILFLANLAAYGALANWSRLIPEDSMRFARDRIAECRVLLVVSSGVLLGGLYALWGNPLLILLTALVGESAHSLLRSVVMALAAVATTAFVVNGLTGYSWQLPGRGRTASERPRRQG